MATPYLQQCYASQLFTLPNVYLKFCFESSIFPACQAARDRCQQQCGLVRLAVASMLILDYSFYGLTAG